jgi:hypothetical protein
MTPWPRHHVTPGPAGHGRQQRAPAQPKGMCRHTSFHPQRAVRHQLLCLDLAKVQRHLVAEDFGAYHVGLRRTHPGVVVQRVCSAGTMWVVLASASLPSLQREISWTRCSATTHTYSPHPAACRRYATMTIAYICYHGLRRLRYGPIDTPTC